MKKIFGMDYKATSVPSVWRNTVEKLRQCREQGLLSENEYNRFFEDLEVKEDHIRGEVFMDNLKG